MKTSIRTMRNVSLNEAWVEIATERIMESRNELRMIKNREGRYLTHGEESLKRKEELFNRSLVENQYIVNLYNTYYRRL